MKKLLTFISHHKTYSLLGVLVFITILLTRLVPETTIPATTPQTNLQSTTYVPPQEIINNPNYEIIYTEYNQLYLISILGSPFEQLRLEAEQAFLKQLSLTSDQACTKKILISQPFFVEQKVQPEYTKLSFCK